MKATQRATKEAPQETPANRPSGDQEVAAFLTALAGLLHDTIGRLEDTVGEVTGRVVSRPNFADRDMVVALQAFDRLQQEFAALSGVLAKYAAKRGAAAEHAAREALLRELLSTISVHDLKQRLTDKMVSADLLPPEAAEADNDDIF